MRGRRRQLAEVSCWRAILFALVGCLIGPLLWASDDPDLLRSERGLITMCETAQLEIGAWWARWALAADFYSDEREPEGRDFAWMRRIATVNMALSERTDRTLTILARSASDQNRVRVRFNGVDLGQLASPLAWTELTWKVPATAVQIGLNRIEVEATRVVVDGERTLGLCVDRLQLDSRAGDCLSAGGYVEVTRTAGPVALRSGQIVVVPVVANPRSRLVVRFGPGTTGTLELFVTSSAGQKPLGTVGPPSSGRAGTVAIELWDDLRTGDELVLVARGEVALAEALVVDSGDSLLWRRGCNSGAVLLTGLLIVVAVIATARNRRVHILRALSVSGFQRSGAQWAPWFDATMIAVTTLAVRELFLHVYPIVDPRRFGDSWEYLFRANKLVDGASFWADTSWHAWQSWIRPPGFYLLLAAVRSFGSDLQLLAHVQVVLAAITGAATYLMAYPLFGRIAAISAGLLFAVYAEAAMSVSWVLTEALYMAFVVPALAALAWLSVRPTSRIAVVAGILFGVATLVRSAPLYFVPMAAALVVVAHGRRGVRPAVVMTAALALTVLPWCVRNSLIYGMPMGVDDIAISNFLQAHPNDALVQVSDVDVNTPAGFRIYYDRLKAANHGAALTSQSGILRAGVLALVRQPRSTMQTFIRNLKSYFAPFPESYPREYQGEDHVCAVVGWTDALNTTYVLVLAFGVGGVLLSLGDRRSWPILLWFVFGAVVVNLIFYPDFMPGRFRLPTMPVMMVYAGAVVQRVITGTHRASVEVAD